MNNQHLQETARHYANLAEQYRTELAEEQQLNENLLSLIDALCEELGVDTEELLEMAMRKADYDARVQNEYDLSNKGKHEASWRSQDKTDRLLRSDKVYDATGKVVHKGARGLGWSVASSNPRDRDVETVQGVVGEVGHIVAAPNDPDYATSLEDIKDTSEHPVYKRILKPAVAPPPASLAPKPKK